MMLLSYIPSSFSLFTILPMAISNALTMAEKTLLSFISLLSSSDPGYFVSAKFRHKKYPALSKGFIAYQKLQISHYSVFSEQDLEYCTQLMRSDGAKSGVRGAENAKYRNNGSFEKLIAWSAMRCVASLAKKS